MARTSIIAATLAAVAILAAVAVPAAALNCNVGFTGCGNYVVNATSNVNYTACYTQNFDCSKAPLAGTSVCSVGGLACATTVTFAGYTTNASLLAAGATACTTDLCNKLTFTPVAVTPKAADANLACYTGFTCGDASIMLQSSKSTWTSCATARVDCSKNPTDCADAGCKSGHLLGFIGIASTSDLPTIGASKTCVDNYCNNDLNYKAAVAGMQPVAVVSMLAAALAVAAIVA